MQMSENVTDSQPHLAMSTKKRRRIYTTKGVCATNSSRMNDPCTYIGCVGFRAFVEKKNMRGRTRRGGGEIAVGRGLGISKAGVLHSLVTACYRCLATRMCCTRGVGPVHKR